MTLGETPKQVAPRSLRKGRYVAPLFLALIAVNFAVRYPYATNLYGTDTFYTMGFASAITKFGGAADISSPLDYLGLPSGQPQAVPFLVSMTAQISGVNAIAANLIFTSVLTVVSVLGMACLALALRRSLAFALTAAIAFSLATRLVTFTINQASTRDLFLALTPVAILFLVKALGSPRRRWTWVALLEGIFPLMLAAHHIGALFLFVITAGVLCIPAALILTHARIPTWARIPAYAAMFGGMLLAPVLRVPGLPSQLPNLYTTGRFFSGTGPVPVLGNMAVDYVSGTGPLIVLVPIGIISILRMKDPRPRQLVAPIIVLVFAMTFIVGYYVWFVLAAPFAILAAYGFDAVRLGSGAPLRRTAAALVIAIVLSGALALYVMDQQGIPASGLQAGTTDTALFLRNEGGDMFAVSDALDSSYRMWTMSGRPPLAYSNAPPIIYGVVSPGEVFDARATFNQIRLGTFGSPTTQYLLTRYQVTDYVQNLQSPTPSAFQTSLDSSAYLIYSNADFQVWHV